MRTDPWANRPNPDQEAQARQSADDTAAANAEQHYQSQQHAEPPEFVHHRPALVIAPPKLTRQRKAAKPEPPAPRRKLSNTDLGEPPADWQPAAEPAPASGTARTAALVIAIGGLLDSRYTTGEIIDAAWLLSGEKFRAAIIQKEPHV